MPSDSLDLLTSKAMLLLRREREVFSLRLERERIELWIKVFHKLSLDLNRKASASLVQEWTELMVGELNFQVAAVYAPRAGTETLALECGQSHVPLAPELGMDEKARRFIMANPSGAYRRQDPEALEEFARAAGLETFFWRRLAIRAQELLLLCGFASGAGKSYALDDYDFSHFELSGKHLAALLDNLGLIAELDGERSELAQSNSQLEQALAQLRRETTDRLQLERELRHAQKLEALGRMIAGIGHEINNPLSYVLSNLEYLRREIAGLRVELGDARCMALGEALDEATSGGERIQSIVSATREFSRPMEEPPRAVDLRESFEAARRMVGNELRHRATLTVALSNVPRVMADPHRLEQVFVNLLMNALHSMPEGRADNEIRVTCAPTDEDYVTLSVSDTGRGIPEQDLERVFEPFYSTRANSRGLGLGLWICRGIIDSFAGRIELQSQVDCGTTVSVHLRVAPSSPAAEDALRQSLAPEGCSFSRPGRVLLVDDEPAVLRGLGRVLRGHEIVMATDGREGLELYRASQFDIVFCDLMMPGFSGMDFVQELEKLGPEHVRRVVLMSGGIVSDSIRVFLANSSNLCVPKPLDSALLRRLIGNSVAHPSQPVNSCEIVGCGGRSLG